jgi:hypothetical protein
VILCSVFHWTHEFTLRSDGFESLPGYSNRSLESVSESELLYEWRFTAKPFVLATGPLRLTAIQLNTCGYSPYVTSFLARGWVCRLHLLLALAIAVILRSDSYGTHDHVLLSQIRDSPNLEGKVPVFISPRNRVAKLYPQTLGSLSVAFITHRAKVEVEGSKSKLLYNWRFTANQFVLEPGPLRLTTRDFFPTQLLR